MTIKMVHRPARTSLPPADEEPRQIEAPPTLPDGKTGGSPMMSLLPVAGVMSSLVMMTILRSGAFVAIGAIVLVVAAAGGILLLVSQRGHAGRTRKTQRERYLDYLERLRDELGEEETHRRALARVLSPSPEALYDVVRDPARLWERRRRDGDFLRLRAGAGRLPARRLRLKEEGSVLTPTDPFMLAEARGLMSRFGAVPALPLVVPLDRAGDVSVVGAREDVLRLVRALLTQFAAFHAPDDAGLALACPPEREDDWAWAKWLPHLLDPRRRDGVVARRRVAADPKELAALLTDELSERAAFATEVRRGLGRKDAFTLMRRLLVIHDTYGRTAEDLHLPEEASGPEQLGLTVLHLVADRLQEPGNVSVRLTLDGRRLKVEDLRGPELQEMLGIVDEAGVAQCEGLARVLAPLRLSADSMEDAPDALNADIPQLLGIEEPAAIVPDELWASRGDRAFLRVPIGIDENGRAVMLDLKEAAQLGMGPHGLCVGATGSGKSELLRTLVLALAATHPPERVAMVLVDYKGGATFAPFASLPHVAGLITNIEDDAGLIERFHASLSGEVQRRQQVLKDAGHVANITDYAALRENRPELEPLPHLLVIIDEFGELLTARPDFIELFLSIGRIGRSIGVHLLLSSQRIEQGKLRGLDTYLSYRLGLRTFSEEESRTVLDTVDAFHLPPLPGFGYLKVDTSVYERFKAGYVSAPYRGPVAEEVSDPGPAVTPYPLFNTRSPYERDIPEKPHASATPARLEMPERSVGTTLLDLVTDRLSDDARRVGQIWLPPLPEALTLDQVRLPRAAERLQVPLGLIDDPAGQWQGRWDLDLTAAGGHVAVIGSPQSGKTTLLRTLVLSLALTHSPREVGVYAVDLAGGGLRPLEGLPHVGGIAARVDRERVRRTVEEVHGMLAEREEVFRVRGIDSMERLRTVHAAGRIPELPCADVVLCLDGFGALRSDFEEIEEMLTGLLQRGGGFGIHVVAGMLRWNDVRIPLQSTFGTHVELHLGDATDSAIDRKLAGTIGADQGGRALTDDKLFGQVALPRTDGVATITDGGEALESAVSTVSAAWPGEHVPPVRMLPHRLPAADLPSATREPLRVPIGLDEAGLEPVLLDLFDADQHLLILGDSECGKTNLLRVIGAGLIDRYGPEELVVAVFDPRRGLHSVIPERYLGGYAATSQAYIALSNGVTKELQSRMPGDDADPAVLAAGAWFTGPRIVVLVDDYDLITTAGQQPLTPFVPFVPSGRDIGLHFVLSRRVAGAARGLYEPLVQSVRESGCSSLVMNGDRSEGMLFPGVYAGVQPPGRGRWLRRGEAVRLIQTAVSDEPA